MQQRAHAAITCSLVADAAAMGVQWIYDTSILEQLLQDRAQVRTYPQAWWNKAGELGIP